MTKLFKVKRIRNAVLFTFLMMFIFQIGSFLTVPGVDVSQLTAGMSSLSTFSMMNILSGGSLEKFSIFALGVGPYITASIIIELLSNDVIKPLAEWKEDGVKGRKKLNQATKYLGVVLAMLQGITTTVMFNRNYGILTNPGWANYLFIAVMLTAGSMFLIWIGDKITEYGVGSGLSLIIVAGILSSLPSTFASTYAELAASTGSVAKSIALLAVYVLSYLLIILAVVFINSGERKIPIAYSGRKLANGANMTYLPIKPGVASVIPVIFASSVMTVPLMIVSFFNYGAYEKASAAVGLGTPIGLVIYAVLIVLFTYFYADLILNPQEIANQLRKNNGYIPGKHPGKETKDYLSKAIVRTVTVGAVALVILALMPYVLTKLINLSTISAIGGTGAILVVGIALDIVATLESAVASEKYKGWF